MQIAQDIIGWLATVILVITLIPQTLKVMKTKQTAGISPVSYSIAFTALTLFILWGSFQGETIGQKIDVIQVFIANFITGLLALIIIFYIYKNIKKPVFFYLSLIFFVVVVVASISGFLVKVNGKYLSLSTIKLGNNFSLSDFVFLIAGGFIAFAFTPQTIMTVKSRSAKNISLGTTIAFALTNLFWAIYYVIFLAKVGWTVNGTASFIMGVIISLLAFGWQLPLLAVKVMDITKSK